MTWDDIQSRGGMKIGVPYKSGDSTHIPLDIEISGIRAITTKPETGSSSIFAIRKIPARVEGDTILFTVIESLMDDRPNAVEPKTIVIDELSPGTYWVVYENASGSMHHFSQLSIKPE